MFEKFAGIPTQIRQLEKKLKDMDASKVKPALIKEITDTINNLKALLKEKQEKREQRKKDKEQKAAETSKEEVTLEADSTTDKVEKDPKVAPHLIVPESLKEHEKVVEKVETSPEVAPHIVSEQEPKAELYKFSVDDKVEPIRGGTGSWGQVMRPADVNGDPLVYVKWMEGPLKEKHGEYGGYYPHDLKKKSEEKPIPPHNAGPEHICPECVDHQDKHADLKDNYNALLKDLKEERDAHYAQGNHPWVARLDQKIQELEEKIKEKFSNEKQGAEFGQHGNGNGLDDLYVLPSTPEEATKIIEFLKSKNHGFEWSNANVKGHSWYGKRFIEIPFGESLKPEIEKLLMTKEAGAQNAEHLTIMDHTPPRANSGPDDGGKDSHDEFQDEWAMPAGTEVTSAKGIPGSLFNAETASHVVEQLKSFLNAPYINAQISTLGGDEHVSIMLTISADPKEKWSNGILENSHYGNFSIDNDGTIEQFSGGFSGFKQPNNFLRKTNVKSVQQLIDVLNAFLTKVNSTPKLSTLKKASVSVSVFNKNWSAEPVNKEGKLSYEISDNAGKKVLSISPLNGKEMNAEHLKWAIQHEITSGFKQAKLTERIAMLPEGTKVFVLAQDKAKKRCKIASFDENIRAWVPQTKIKLMALEQQMVQHGGHSDPVLGATGTETLLDCVDAGPIWVSSTELLDNNRPPATPESLNDLESKKKLPHTEECNKANDHHVGPTEVCICNNKESAKECPDCHGTFVGKEDEKCPTCGRFSVDKEALKTALSPTIPNQRGYLDNPPVEKEAAPCTSGDLILSGPTGLACANCGAEKGSDGVVHHDPKKNPQLHASLNKQARVVHREDGWHVLSEKGKNLGGPYGSKEEAVKRLRQVEFYKHQGSQRPFSKKEAEVLADPYQSLTDHITDMRSRMTQVQERLQSNPLPKQAGEDEKDNSEMDLAEVFEDLTMGIDLLETKFKDTPESEELHKNLEELENLLWETEMKAGITPKLSEEEKAEPEHKEIVKEVEKESSKTYCRCGHSEFEHGEDGHAQTRDCEHENCGCTSFQKKEVEKEAASRAHYHTCRQCEVKMGKECGCGYPKVNTDLCTKCSESSKKEASWPLCSVDGCNNKADSVGVDDNKRYCYTHSWGHKQKMKEAALPTAITPTLSNSAPTTNATPATTPDDKKPTCALCGGMSFGSFDQYQQHMTYTHASDTMPTKPSQPTLASKKEAGHPDAEYGEETYCAYCDEIVSSKQRIKTPQGYMHPKCKTQEIKDHSFKKEADVMTDETITTNDPNAVIPDPTVPATPTIQNVRPTDDDNLDVPVVKPTSPPPPGTQWIFDTQFNKYVIMPLNSNQTI